ncbi:ABC transporter ATP-binding protein [Litoreibacter albidus]|uniref:Nucleoside ABC transporter ATP-binding protein n=1 Tax=Litoreibacter albidus TaxID=670155 RepID=A0A1H2Z6L9_9RHOB|nr:ABC transporter ATP-binding protein [Litoreibacter albidus]SDX12986.1 nucleoside ABC transporter ATP-binding protein [Litoreibacter albidus]
MDERLSIAGEDLLTIEGLTKAYPGVVANDHVSLSIRPGEVHALLGENGAGKSTLVKMIYGLVKPDAGTMTFKGAPFAPAEPRAARATGVAMVFQHFSLFEALDVAENIALGMENPPKMRDLSARIREVSETYGLPLDPDQLVGDLSAGERQRVEIIRCLLQNPKLLIMDEPTSVLTPQEVAILFQTLEKLRGEGCSILYISHKLEEIRALCDYATVLRLGKKVATCNPRQETARAMAEMMVGGELHVPQKTPRQPQDVALEITALDVAARAAFGTSLKGINLSVQKGEILGIGGVAGNGQDELCSVISGEILSPDAKVKLAGAPIGQLGPNARRALGVLAAPEERLGHAAAPDMSLTENALLSGAVREGLQSHGMIDWGKTREFAKQIIQKFDVRTPSPNTAARALSGGNLQKFVIGREIIQNPTVFVVNQPTWGVDASAAAAIRQALLDLAAAGAAIVVISQDLDELMEISDRFAALNEGRLSAPVEAAGLTVDQIGLMLGGAHDLEPAKVAQL